MFTIHKQILRLRHQTLTLPLDAEILSIQNQKDSIDEDNNITLWYKTSNPNGPTKESTFNIYGTGWDVDSAIKQVYITTVQCDNLVWHIFEELAYGGI